MEKTAVFNMESIDSLVERFQVNGLETINLGNVCFRFVPALNGMNLVSVLTKISRMVQSKRVSTVQGGFFRGWHFNFYADFIQYLINRNIKFEMRCLTSGVKLKDRLDLVFLCRELETYRRKYEEKLRSA